jgi:hypothetical protein
MGLGMAGSFLGGFLGASLGIHHANDAVPGLSASVTGAVGPPTRTVGADVTACAGRSTLRGRD